MRLLILNRRSLLTASLCLIAGIAALSVSITSVGKAAVQTAAEPKTNPIYRVESDKKQVAISFDAAWGNEETSQLLDRQPQQHPPSYAAAFERYGVR